MQLCPAQLVVWILAVWALSFTEELRGCTTSSLTTSQIVWKDLFRVRWVLHSPLLLIISLPPLWSPLSLTSPSPSPHKGMWRSQAVHRHPGQCSSGVSSSYSQNWQHIRNWLQTAPESYLYLHLHGDTAQGVLYHASCQHTCITVQSATHTMSSSPLPVPQGEFYNIAHPVEAPYTPPPLPPINDTSKMLYIWLTDYIADTAGYVYQAAGALQYTITADMVSPSSPIQLNTSSFCDLIPEVSEIPHAVQCTLTEM